MSPPVPPAAPPLTLAIKAVPGASRDQIAGVLAHPAGPRLKVRTTAPPEGGRANTAIIQLIARELGCRPADITLLHGAAHPEKTLAFAPGSVDPARLAALLTAPQPAPPGPAHPTSSPS